MNSSHNQPIQTLRLSDRDKAKLLWAIESAGHRPVESSARRLRVVSKNNDAILTLIDENGKRTRLAVLLRDLSRWGASLVHGRYIYPGTKCQIEFKTLEGDWASRVGKVRHVRHVQGLIHNLGVQFNESIDLSEFVLLSQQEESLHLQEMVDDTPEGDFETNSKMTKRVLIVDDFASDRKLFSYWLTRAEMEAAVAHDSASAGAQVQENQYDLLIIDNRLGGESGPKLINSLRQSQYVGPILAVSASEEEGAKNEALSAGANRFLVKPFTAEQLVEAAHELMGMRSLGDQAPIYSKFNDDNEMRPVLNAFARALPEHIEQLNEANAKHNYELIEKIVLTLKGAGSGYGLSEISEQAGDVVSALNDDEAEMDRIRETVNDLIDTLSRVRLR